MSTEDFHAMSYEELHRIAESINPEGIRALASAWDSQQSQHRDTHDQLFVQFKSVVEEEHWTGKFADAMLDSARRYDNLSAENADTASTQIVGRLNELAEKAAKAKSMVLAQGIPSEVAILKPREQSARIDAAAQGLHEYYGSLGESPVPAFDPFKTGQEKSARPVAAFRTLFGQPDGTNLTDGNNKTSSPTPTPVDDKQTVECTPGDDCPEDLKKRLDKVEKEQHPDWVKKIADDATDGAIAGGITGAVAGGVTGSLADGVGAIPGALAGGAIGATTGALGAVVKDTIDWLEE